MTDAPIPEPFKPKFFCPLHGATNQVMGLDEALYCVPCLAHVAKDYGAPVFRMSDIQQ